VGKQPGLVAVNTLNMRFVVLLNKIFVNVRNLPLKHFSLSFLVSSSLKNLQNKKPQPITVEAFFNLD
jgi:hypothetical protein